MVHEAESREVRLFCISAVDKMADELGIGAGGSLPEGGGVVSVFDSAIVQVYVKQTGPIFVPTCSFHHTQLTDPGTPHQCAL